MTTPDQPAAELPNTAQAFEPTIDLTAAARVLKYRCSCGSEIVVTESLTACPECGHSLPRSLANNPSMTMSFCNLSLDETSGISSGTQLFGAGRGSQTRNDSVSRTGQRLGHFLLHESLGEGGMGAVYRALDTSLQRYVAVKVLREGGDGSTSSNARYHSRLLQEAISQARLNHPRVVTIYYVGREGEEPFLAMELLPGPTLQQRLESGPLPYEEVIEYAIQVSEALEAADQSGMVHGDIKPSNLLMVSSGNIKLSDFGLARRSGSSSEDGSISGTPSYIAPEILDGAAPDRRTDMFALGVTLFELTFGRKPFELTGTTLRDQLLSHKTAEIQFPQKWPTGVPEGFRAVLSRLIARSPEDRYPSYTELLVDLHAARPVGSTLAGLPTRFIAYVIDMVSISIVQGMFIAPHMIVRLVAMEDSGSRFLEDLATIPHGVLFAFTFSLALFGWVGLPLLTLWWDLKRYRTLGRFLMQVRVVDGHGLPPSRRAIIIRNMLRYAPFWTSVISGPLVSFGWLVLGVIDDLVWLVWLLIDSIYVLFPSRRALHDRICDTHVVLDERATSRRPTPERRATSTR